MASLRYPTTLVNELINDGNRDMTVRTGCQIVDFVFTPQVNQFFYDLPSDLVRLHRFYRTDTPEKVWPISVDQLDLVRPAWPDISGNRLEWYFLFGLDQLVTGPKIGSVGSLAYSITMSQDPGETQMSADTDEPSVPRAFHESLIDYAVGRALMIDADEEMIQNTVSFLGNYQKDVKKLTSRVNEHIDRRFRMRPQDPTNFEPGTNLEDGISI